LQIPEQFICYEVIGTGLTAVLSERMYYNDCNHNNDDFYFLTMHILSDCLPLGFFF